MIKSQLQHFTSVSDLNLKKRPKISRPKIKEDNLDQNVSQEREK